MILLRLFYEFFKTGLFSVGGGMATIPFLQHMGETTGWFTNQDLTTMIAVSESTPGPLGVNMATYVGYQTAGVPGALVATLGVITPGAILILIIAGFLQKFRSNRSVEAVFAGLRPASTALIAAAGLSVAYSVFTASDALSPNSFPAIQWTAVVLTLAMFAAMKWTPLKNFTLSPLLRQERQPAFYFSSKRKKCPLPMAGRGHFLIPPLHRRTGTHSSDPTGSGPYRLR